MSTPNPNPEPSFTGANFAAAKSISVPATDPEPLVIDHEFIAAVADKSDATRLTVDHHRARHAAATGAALTALEVAIDWVEQLVASGGEACHRISQALAKVPVSRQQCGGDQPRTPSVLAQVFGLLALAAGTVVCDWLLIGALAREVIGPDLAADFLFLFPIAFPILAATGALKVYPLLRYPDETARTEAERKFARVLPWVLPLLLLAVAKRLAGWTVNPVDTLFDDTAAAVDLALTIGAYVLQLGGMSVVAAAALMAACELLRRTRPSTSKPNEEHKELKKQLEDEMRTLNDNWATLGALKAEHAKREGLLQVFLDAASAALAAAQFEREATARHLDAMRSRRGPAPTRTSGPVRIASLPITSSTH